MSDRRTRECRRHQHFCGAAKQKQDNDAEARELCTKAHNSGNIGATFNLAMLLCEGRGGPKDEEYHDGVGIRASFREGIRLPSVNSRGVFPTAFTLTKS